MNKYLVFGALIVGCLCRVDAQSSLEFLKMKHDFGEMEEERGSVDYGFQFINNSLEAITIEHVEAECGCTTPGWTEEAVLPGDTGVVHASYDPFNRPGKFEKKLTVFYKDPLGNDQKVTLTIEGMVNPKPKTIEEELPVAIGNLRLKYRSLNVGKITTEKEITKAYEVYNSGSDTLVWLPKETNSPSHIDLLFLPKQLPPHSLGSIVLTYDPEKRDDLGFVNDQVSIATNEQEDNIKELNVIATITEYFPEMTEKELDRAPKLVFDKTQYDYGQVKAGDQVVVNFTLTNNGKEKLLIRKIKPNCGCTVTSLKSNKIRPGDSVELQVVFDTTGRKGRQYKTVTVFSNDPTASAQMLTLKAQVIE